MAQASPCSEKLFTPKGSLSLSEQSKEKQETMQRELAQGFRALNKIRWIVGGSMLSLSLILGTAALVCYYVLHLERPDKFTTSVLLAVLIATLFIVSSLAPLPGDRGLTRCALTTQSVFAVLEAALCGVDIVDALGGDCVDLSSHCAWAVTMFGCWLIIDAVFLLYTAIAFFTSNAILMQLRMWNAVSLYLILMVVANGTDTVVQACWFHKVSSSMCFIPPYIIAVCISMRPNLRYSFHAYLRRCFDAHGATAAASGIACLLGNKSSKALRKQASQRFRSVPLIDLNLLQASNGVSSQPKALGECDAFISHSWHDDAESKQQALKQWGDDFQMRKGRTPNVWLDRCCIDQANIEADLCCLPIFMSGCKELVILCGPTYLSRLWCVLELFVFRHMGGSLDNVRFIPVLRQGYEVEDMLSIKQAFQDFDASKCTCLDESDKCQILTMVHIAFGSIRKFSETVTEILSEAVDSSKMS